MPNEKISIREFAEEMFFSCVKWGVCVMALAVMLHLMGITDLKVW